MDKFKGPERFEDLLKSGIGQGNRPPNPEDDHLSSASNYNHSKRGHAQHITPQNDIRSESLSGIDAAEKRKLKRGQIAVRTVCDLHGFTRHEALIETERYLSDRQAQNQRYGLVIVGKGHHSKDRRPAIKATVLSYLYECQQVVGYAPAHPSQGGDGAVYVILRKSR